MRIVLKSKIHRATVTQTDIDYEGSIGIDAGLLRAADIFPYEQVHVLDVTNGARFETYAIEEVEGSGCISINGAAARLTHRGDTIIILSYAMVDEAEAHAAQPRIIVVGTDNAPILAAHGRTDEPPRLLGPS